MSPSRSTVTKIGGKFGAAGLLLLAVLVLSVIRCRQVCAQPARLWVLSLRMIKRGPDKMVLLFFSKNILKDDGPNNKAHIEPVFILCSLSRLHQLERPPFSPS